MNTDMVTGIDTDMDRDMGVNRDINAYIDKDLDVGMETDMSIIMDMKKETNSLNGRYKLRALKVLEVIKKISTLRLNRL
jgi:hypothetical protein